MTSSHETINSKICIRVWGGLANQMFQYAAGLATAERLGCELLIDRAPSKGDHATYGLDLFGIEHIFWEPDDQPDIMTSLKQRFQSERKVQKNKYRQWNGKHFKQESFCYADDFQTIERGTYIEGYFQSEQFFADCPDQIRSAFTLDHLAPSLEAALLALCDHPHSISVHIRRGDYVTNAKVTNTHGVLDASYYETARALMLKQIPDAQFLIFSDDIEAAGELVKDWPNTTLVRDQNRETDLYLMSRCASHIIANSSFSWWGAWLGQNPDKTVIAPRQWFSKREMRTTYIDELYPQGWILV